MASFFKEEWEAASSNIDVYFGEGFTYRPMKLVAGRIAPDPSRAIVLLTAALTDSARIFDPVGERNASGMSKNVSSSLGASEAVIDLAVEALPYAPQSKDRIERSADGAVFEVTGVLADDFARLKLRVAKMGALP